MVKSCDSLPPLQRVCHNRHAPAPAVPRARRTAGRHPRYDVGKTVKRELTLEARVSLLTLWW